MGLFSVDQRTFAGLRPRRASGSALSADRQTLNDFVIVKVLFRIPQRLIIVKKFENKIELDVVVSTTVKT